MKQQTAEMVGGAEEGIIPHLMGTANASYFHATLLSPKQKIGEGCIYRSLLKRFQTGVAML